MKNILIILFSIPFLANAQLINGDFEDIETITLSNGQTYQKPVGWCYAWAGNYGTEITTDSYSGNYAMKLWSWYFIQSNEELHYGNNSHNLVPFTSRPEKLKGYYKFTNPNIQPNNIPDSAYVNILMTKYNQSLNLRDTISFTEYNLGENNTYSSFEIDLNYSSNQSPDSLQIYFRTSYFQGPSDGTNNSNYLFLDNLSFVGNPLSTNEIESENLFVIYPNPAREDINIVSKVKFKSVKIISADGKLIKEFYLYNPNDKFTINMESYKLDVYFIQLIGINDEKLGLKKIVKK